MNLLEFTIEYLKQTADFQRGVGLCAAETRTFLKQHIFDRNKISALFEKLQQRIDYISKPDYIRRNNFVTVNGQQQNIANSYQIDDSVSHCNTDQNTGTGVLIDLSMKQNRLTDKQSHDYNSTTIRNLCKNMKKREILDKIRKKILDKRRDTIEASEVVQDDIMWRPWRF